MQEIELKSSPNQNTSFIYGTHTYLFHIYTVSGGFTMADISENGHLLVAGMLCSPSTYILSQPTEVGNFKFECVMKDYPYYREFNGTQKLYFVPASEIE